MEAIQELLPKLLRDWPAVGLFLLGFLLCWLSVGRPLSRINHDQHEAIVSLVDQVGGLAGAVKELSVAQAQMSGAAKALDAVVALLRRQK